MTSGHKSNFYDKKWSKQVNIAGNIFLQKQCAVVMLKISQKNLTKHSKLTKEKRKFGCWARFIKSQDLLILENPKMGAIN